jgi:hypothetical protein
MSNRYILVEFLKYTQEQDKIYETMIKTMQDSHKETSALLTTYFTNLTETPTETPAETPTETPVETPTETPVETPTETPAETPTETPVETPINTRNNIIDNSLNDVASLSDISTLINVLRENINSIRPPQHNSTRNSILANGRHITHPRVTFSTLDNRRIVHEIPRSNITPTRPRDPSADYRLNNQRIRQRVLRTPVFFENADSVIDTGNLDSPVRIRPSITQIRNGTQLITTTGDISDNAQTHCPIDLNIFAEGDVVLKIIGCGHIFREMNLRNHFRYNTRCPMCRYDIRDYVVPTESP